MFVKGNITLRGIEPEDIGFIMAIENNASFWHVSDTHNPYTRFDIEQYIITLEKDIYKAKQLRLIIEDSMRSKQLGIIDIYEFDAHNRRAGIGIILAEEAVGKGVAGKALDMIIEYSFSFLRLHQLYCTIGANNTNSLKLFRGRGFIETAIKKDWKFINGKFVDHLLLQRINQNQK